MTPRTPPIFLLVGRGDLVVRGLLPFLSVRSLTAISLSCRRFYRQIYQEEVLKVLPGRASSLLPLLAAHLDDPEREHARSEKKTRIMGQYFWTPFWIGRLVAAQGTIRWLTAVCVTERAKGGETAKSMVSEVHSLLQWYPLLDPILKIHYENQ